MHEYFESALGSVGPASWITSTEITSTRDTLRSTTRARLAQMQSLHAGPQGECAEPPCDWRGRRLAIDRLAASLDRFMQLQADSRLPLVTS